MLNTGRRAENRVPVRRVLGLAVPALGVLAAEPLYVLVDTAVVGHLGALPLAGLALGGVLLSLLSKQLTFLSYGTTARAARLHGADKRSEAVTEGAQASWLGLFVGVVVVVLGQVFAGPITRGLAGNDAIAAEAESWLRIAVFGAPLILIAMAGHGWMRGVQDAVRPLRFVLAGNGLSAVLCPILVYPVGMGLEGSAVANVVAQFVAASLFVRALVRERAPLRPDGSLMRAQLGFGRDLVLRSLAFQVCFVSATAVAARTSAAAVGGHQVVLELWTFLSLILDSVAIAAQSLVGAELGGSRPRKARGVADQITGYGFLLGCVLCVLFATVSGVLPLAFTSDAEVLAVIPHAWWFFVAMQPIAGVVFALDGVLIGAGDVGYLRTTTIVSALLGFLPLIWLSLLFGWGLVGIWSGLTLFVTLRMVAVVWRWRGDKWLVAGTVPA